jgi:hypothetical protein
MVRYHIGALVVILAAAKVGGIHANNTLRADFLFSYRPSPGTVFFAGYGNSLTESDPLAFQRLRRIGDGFFLKVSYVFGTKGSAPGG